MTITEFECTECLSPRFNVIVGDEVADSDLLEAVAVKCSACGEEFRIEPGPTYVVGTDNVELDD